MFGFWLFIGIFSFTCWILWKFVGKSLAKSIFSNASGEQYLEEIEILEEKLEKAIERKQTLVEMSGDLDVNDKLLSIESIIDTIERERNFLIQKIENL